ncbi:MAG TPA: RDD family protein [Pyrinomonadaceae bacterium]|nr:RDD family protein [Pyrinomonadaceae bacterium]
MQCVVCGGSYSESVENCPHCPATDIASADEAAPPPEENPMPTSTGHERQTKRATAPTPETKGASAAAAATSTLIEFPGVPPKPQWRKELSERVREIQQRRALEAAREAEASNAAAPSQPGHISFGIVDDPTSDVSSGAAAETSAPPLGLVPPPPQAPQPNPLVVAALKRIERARQANPLPPVARASRGGAAAGAATARVVEENYQTAPDTEIIHGHAVALNPTGDAQVGHAAVVEEVERPSETARSTPLAIVPPAALAAPATKTAEAGATGAQPRARRHIPVVADEASLSRIEEQMHAAVLSNHAETPEKSVKIVAADDYAPVSKRIAGGIIDLLVVAFASTPFAAIIELTSGNWADMRVAASMFGIVVVLMFLYLMTATALAGRTWGMSVVSLRTVDAQTGSSPSTGQCVRRAAGYLLSLATLGLGLLYACFDAEGRAAHDHLSGTIVIAD